MTRRPSPEPRSTSRGREGRCAAKSSAALAMALLVASGGVAIQGMRPSLVEAGTRRKGALTRSSPRAPQAAARASARPPPSSIARIEVPSLDQGGSRGFLSEMGRKRKKQTFHFK